MSPLHIRLMTSGSSFSPKLFLVFVIIGSFLIQLVDCTLKNSASRNLNNEDNEFAEFEEVDESSFSTIDNSLENKENVEKTSDSLKKDSKLVTEKKFSAEENIEDSEGLVEDETDEDALHLKDDAEFENFDASSGKKGGSKQPGSDEPKQLKITEVPAHLRNNWSNFQVELIMLIGLAIYLVNYAIGKAKNHKLATTWFETHREILYNSFEVVGDDGTTQEVQKNVLMKESDHVYSLWCSGRPGCLGALIQLRLLKRQDLITLVTSFFKPQSDKLIIRFNLAIEEMDTCVVALGEKKNVAKLVKETTDLSQYCTEKKNADWLGLPESFCLYAEIAESANAILDAKTLGIIQKYEDLVDYVHASDQYCGLKANEGETQTKIPDTSRVVIFSFNVPSSKLGDVEAMEELKPLLMFALYCVEKIRRFKLSKEAKTKCDKNRMTVQESYMKQSHAQRQEAAQVRREEKVRERKERVLAEEDPDKQRRMEKLEQKREMKKKQPKVKQLKIKAG